MPSGGYRKPSNPAPVSGPGALSKRTDGGPTQPATYISGLPYGQGQETMSQQQAAPMAGTAPTPSMPPIIPLTAPTMRPNEPITTGMDIGLGAGSEVLNLPKPRSLSEILGSMLDVDQTGEVQELYNFVVSRGL